jgi:hypothetical protein
MLPFASYFLEEVQEGELEPFMRQMLFEWMFEVRTFVLI